MTFTPEEIINYSGEMAIINNDHDVEVSLEGPEAELNLSADSLYFPLTAMGSSSELPLSITNEGDLELVINELSVGSPEIFAVEWNPNDTIVAPGERLDLTVIFSPQQSTLYIDFLRMETNDGEAQVFLHGIEENATIEVELIPHTLNILIPSWGGSFNFDVMIENPYEAVTVNFWTAVELPSGAEIPIITRNGLSFEPEEILVREDMTQFVPASVPAGSYFYYAYLSDPETWEIISSDCIPFDKAAGDCTPAHHEGWALYGWDDPGYSAPQPPEFFDLAVAPNPFNPVTTLTFDLPKAGNVSLVVYDVTGRVVEVLAEGYSTAGRYEKVFDGAGLSSGVYFARLEIYGGASTAESRRHSVVRKMLLVK